MELTTADGTTLNTALADEVASFSDGRERSDPAHVFEVLYRQKQHWFIRRRRDGKDELIPFTADQACTWMRQKNFINALGQHFGERVTRTPVSVL